MRLILASESARRKGLLIMVGASFLCVPANLDETLPPGLPVRDGPVYLAAEKAKAVAARYPRDLVIGCDTGVLIDGEMLGKPETPAHAAEMLARLSGRTHEVMTGCAICADGRTHTFDVTTRVTFYPLQPAQIARYVQTGEPMDKAGAYGIQDKGSLFVSRIEGDYFNVVGLPLARLAREMEAHFEFVLF